MTAALTAETRATQIRSFTPEFYARFIEYTDRKETTAREYRNSLKRFALWTAEQGIQQPRRTDIQMYRDYLKGSGLAVSTQAQYLQAVKHFFKWTAAEGLYPDIADNIHGPKVSREIHRKDALQREEVSQIAKTIDRTTEQGKRLYAMYLLCITGGLRCIELHRRDIGDIKKAGSRCYLYIQGKGRDEKDAPILLVPEVQEAIADYLEARTDSPTKASPLFASTSNRSKGGRIATTTISGILKELLVNAGFDSDRLTAHSLRHTSGTGAYKATGNIYLAQKHQRHADPATTEIYIHAEERETRNTEAQVYEYYFGGSSGKESEAAARQRRGELLDAMDPAQLQAVIDYMKGILQQQRQ